MENWAVKEAKGWESAGEEVKVGAAPEVVTIRLTYA
jgi:hypothetical protein